MLNDYLNRVQLFLHDTGGNFYSSTDLTGYINLARGQIAAESECVRVLPSDIETVANQEVYPFSSFDAKAQTTAGVQSILDVKSIAVSWGSMRPMLKQYIWSDFQAYLRSQSTGMTGTPVAWAKYAQGQNGSAYLFPVPSQISSMDWDCVCLPVDLVDDTTVEAIPYPWTDCVAYYAAALALEEAQRADEAAAKMKQYEGFMQKARAYTGQSFVPSYY